MTDIHYAYIDSTNFLTTGGVARGLEKTKHTFSFVSRHKVTIDMLISIRWYSLEQALFF